MTENLERLHAVQLSHAYVRRAYITTPCPMGARSVSGDYSRMLFDERILLRCFTLTVF